MSSRAKSRALDEVLLARGEKGFNFSAVIWFQRRKHHDELSPHSEKVGSTLDTCWFFGNNGAADAILLGHGEIVQDDQPRR